MSFFEFSHTRTYESDLGWLIWAMKKLIGDMTEFTEINSIKFGDPINWNIATQYEPTTIVVDDEGNGYISRKAVPAGIALTDTEYWTRIFNFSDITDVIRESIAVNAGNSATTPVALEKNDLVWWNNRIYKVLYDIAAGTAFIDGTNVVLYTVDKKINDMTTSIDAEITNRENADLAINEALNAEITNRENADLAINEALNAEIENRIEADNELLEKISSIVIMPEDYGALGDGITDSTDAINQCFAENPNATIIFKKGLYLISDTLHVFGNQGGQTIILGGATLKWTGAADTSKAFIAVDDVVDTESRAHIIGGTLLCEDKVGIGIFNNMFHTTIDSVKIIDPANEGIRIGTSGESRSLQTVIKNCYMQISRASSQGWSDENTLKGIAAYEPDGLISDSNINRFNTSLYLESQGYEVVNCHFTASYKTARSSAQGLAETKGVVISPANSQVINANTFTNIYFDNHKYCIYGAISNRVVCSIVNSKYFNMGHLVDGNFNAYMLGGYATLLNVDDFTIVPASNCIFYDASFVQNANFQNLQLLKQNYKKTVYGISTDIEEIAQHFMNPNEYAQFINRHRVETTQAIRVGSIMFLSGAANLGYCPIITLKYRRQNVAAVDLQLQYQTSQNKFVPLATSEFIRGDSVGTPEIVIGEREDVTINGLTCVRFPIYFRNTSQTLTNWTAYIALDYVSPIKFYANEDSRNIVDYSTITNPTVISLSSL